jgi:hypothetical protein
MQDTLLAIQNSTCPVQWIGLEVIGAGMDTRTRYRKIVFLIKHRKQAKHSYREDKVIRKLENV